MTCTIAEENADLKELLAELAYKIEVEANDGLNARDKFGKDLALGELSAVSRRLRAILSSISPDEDTPQGVDI